MQMEIKYNPSGINLTSLTNDLAFSTWLWALRTGIELHFLTTTDTAPAAGQVLIRNGMEAEWAAQGGTETAPNAYTVNNKVDGGKLVILNPHIAATEQYGKLLMHEIGHALGYFTFFGGVHSNDADDIMHPIVGQDTFLITTADVQGVAIFTSLPRPGTADMKSAVLTPNMDIYHPDINGKQVWLDHNPQASFFNGTATWDIGRISVNEESQGSASYLDGDIVYVHSIQSMGADYSATLQIVGNQVRLVDAHLI
jgi:hypothetical protein